MLGGDALRRCVLELESGVRQPGSATPGRLVARLFAPSSYVPPPRVAVGWQWTTYIAATPHVRHLPVCVS